MTAETGDLKWEVPEDDGGSPITGYIIEVKDMKRKSWREAGTSENLEFTVDKLVDGNEYLMRVAAKNDYGVSDFVELTEPVLAKNPYSK